MLLELFKKFSISTLKNCDKLLLKELEGLVKELKGTNSINYKVQIIKSKPELRSLLQLIYSPESKFHLTSASLQKYSDSSVSELPHDFLIDILKFLSDRRVGGKAAAQMVLAYIKMHPEHEELINNIIDKNLKVRIGYETVKKAFNSAEEQKIPCVLGYSVDKHMNYFKHSLESGDKWFISRKYDGIRTFLVYDHLNESVTLLTRYMNPIKGLNPTITKTIQENLRKIADRSIILDGELVFIDKVTGKEDFSKTITLVKSLEPKDIDGLEFRAFDLIGGESAKFSGRYEKLKDLITFEGFVKIVDQFLIEKDEFDYENLVEKSKSLCYEGFMLRRDCELVNGRSRDLLKLKPFQDVECSVIGYEIGPMRLMSSDGLERTEQVLLSITVDYQGQPVNVGSGFNTSERRYFAKDPSKIMNKIVTIRYQNESSKLGREEAKKSLRFPVFKFLHGNIREE